MSRLGATATIQAPEPDRGLPAAVHTEPRLDRLLRLSGHGNRLAFAALYDATSPQVYTLALRLVLDVADAEQVTEEVYAHAWRHSARHRPRDGDAQAWLLSITRDRSRLLVRALLRSRS